ncbi:hypothetical protein [Deefgea rivuli]|uniref:hypothetical protein n=1 Tax=Deefgea rivuli TaxID=400948 RepID=UPI00056D2711|nr:hypothetical protein [Deefgea rivuli]
MAKATSSAYFSEQLLAEQSNFSLVLGGPLFQLLRRAHLTDDAEGLLWRRIIVISLLAWLPLCLITLLSGSWYQGATIPFLYDLEVHVRFLLAIPIMIAAELLVHRRMRKVVQQFLQRQLIPNEAMQQFETALHSAFELRNSIKAELILIALVYSAGIFLWRNVMVLDTNTWYAHQGAEGLSLTLAGYWYAGVSLPIFQFLVARWYYRLWIWARFLWQVSRIKLQLLPSHSDRLGGLAFLSGTFHAFAPLAFAHGTMLAAMLANRIFYQGAVLTDFKIEIVLMIIWVQLLILAPLLVFRPQLAQAKRDALREYGLLVMQHNREFDQKWFRSGKPKESPLGNPDMSSLVDLGASFDVVQAMNTVPIKKDAILFLAIATVAPLIPLALTMMPLEELVRKLLGLVF